MAFLITGGTGFVGSHIARRLLASGHRVIVCDISLDGDVIRSLKGLAQPHKLRIVHGDITKKGVLNRLVENQEISAIIHMASLLGEACDRDSSQAIEVNCLGMARVLDAATRYNVARVVWGSSIAAAEQRQADDIEGLPSWALVYAATVSFNERLAKVYRDKFNLGIFGLRFPYIFGAGRVRGASFAQKMIARSLAGKPVRVPFGDEVMDWLYIEDAVQAVCQALAATQNTRTAYSIPGDLRSMREVALYLEKTCPGARIELEPGRSGLTWRCDTTGTESDLGYRPRFRVEDGIEDLRRLTRPFEPASLSESEARPGLGLDSSRPL